MKKVQGLVRGFPLELALGAVTAIHFSSIYATMGDEGRFITYLAVTIVVWLAVFASSMLSRLGLISGVVRVLLSTGAVAAGIVVAQGFFDPDLITHRWTWGLFVVAGVAAVSLVPMLPTGSPGEREARFLRINLRLLTRLVVAGLFATATMLGLTMAVWAIVELFGATGLLDALPHLGAWIVAVLMPLVFLVGLGESLDEDAPLPEPILLWGARVGTWLFLPLGVLFLVIACVWGIHIALGYEATSNAISPVILATGALLFGGLFVVAPHRGREDFALLAKVYQLLPVALLLVLPLAAWAVLERVDQYGWTEFRYLRLVAITGLGLISTYGAVTGLRRRAMRLSSIPAVVFIAAILSAMGPWSASEVAKASQLERLRALEVAESFEKEWVGYYLLVHHGEEVLREYSGGLQGEEFDAFLREFAGYRRHDKTAYYNLEAPSELAIPYPGVLLSVHVYEVDFGFRLGRRGHEIRGHIKDNTFHVTGTPEPLRAPLDTLVATPESREWSFPVRDHRFDEEVGRLFVSHAGVIRREGEEPELRSVTGHLLLKNDVVREFRED